MRIGTEGWINYHQLIRKGEYIDVRDAKCLSVHKDNIIYVL